jgi:hypothetical protein
VDCVSYDVSMQPTQWASTADLSATADRAFARWTAVDCPGGGKPSIELLDRGPVACGAHEYNDPQTRSGGNANIVVVLDSGWTASRDDEPTSTLALTTVTFDLVTAEIYDADIEINGEKSLSMDDVPAASSFDLDSIITHEAGHFLGLSHSRATCSAATCPTMNAAYLPGSTKFRTLEADDIAGICAIYPPGRQAERTACVPNYGFSSACGTPKVESSGCAAAPGRARFAPWALIVLVYLCLRRRR